MSYKDILKSLQKKAYLPVYLLHGEEPFYIDEITNFIENNVLTEDEKAFNMTILYGKEVDFKDVLDSAKRYPMMAERQVVIVKEAQELKSIDQLEGYFANPLETTILVLAHKHKNVDKRKKFVKTIEEAVKKNKAVVFESSKLKDYELPNWIMDYLKGSGFDIGPDAAHLLSEYLGNDLSKITNELDKLQLNLPKGSNISTQNIQENIGISKDYNVFELQSALARRDTQKSYQIAQYFMANPKSNPLPMVLGVLYNFLSKAYICSFLPDKYDQTIATAINQPIYGGGGGGNKMSKRFEDYREATKNYSRLQFERILGLLKEYDLRSKGVGLPFVGDEFSEHTEHGELLRELVLKILSKD